MAPGVPLGTKEIKGRRRMEEYKHQMRTNPWRLETQTPWRRTVVPRSNPTEGEDVQRPATFGEERGPFRYGTHQERDTEKRVWKDKRGRSRQGSMKE
ncbi:hypothetical protein NDU88_001828 [Pleurodeles waltl]|uniref:Uncharacterized protein n=1 Tax=Pleurodeles waltl TaxID=8319 RepID=A0AAV7L1N8_PLEWA|nr:hypothetical protein NDU88_001828 [Pleurodeles waltl]